MEEWLDKVLKELDREYDHNMKLSMRLEKEGRCSASERYYQYASGISHTIAKIVEAYKNAKKKGETS